MDARFTPNFSQKAERRPIAFALENAGSIEDTVYLTIRPEDLTYQEPSRTAVHQTLGRDVLGWIDEFGPGLPSITISGHTGWRTAPETGKDGRDRFEDLHYLVHTQYHNARQIAVNAGLDPSVVKLIFIDTLDQRNWWVTPNQFTLKRSKSRPLLYQYNINLQAVSTSLDVVPPLFPNLGSPSAGLRSLGDLASRLTSLSANIASGFGLVDRLKALVAPVRGFLGNAVSLFRAVTNVARSVKSLATSVAGVFIGVARDVAEVGRNVFQAINTIRGLPFDLKAAITAVGSAFNEAVCIFRNSLRPRQKYEDFTGLYGASTCSSTTFGRQASVFGNTNPFALMAEKPPVQVTPEAIKGIQDLRQMDPVLRPMTPAEMAPRLSTIAAGVSL
jgi:hypothetical protein